MNLSNQFIVPLAPRDTWALLNDVPRVVPCLPGAELLEANPDRSYVGKVAVRLGPVSLSFRGTVVYENVDEENMQVTARASGNEQKARGSAQALVVFKVAPADEGSRVTIDTDLQLAGSIAQYARGGKLVQTAAQVIINEFASNLERELKSGNLVPGAATGENAGQPVQGAKAISATGLIWKTVKQSIGGDDKK